MVQGEVYSHDHKIQQQMGSKAILVFVPYDWGMEISGKLK